ncbi:MAG: tetratricopeptide repeat protein [Acidobacteriota bacterium]
MRRHLRAARCRSAERLGEIVCALVLAALLSAPIAMAQDPAAQRLFDESDRLLAGDQQEQALDTLRLLLRQFPNDELSPRALLRVARLERSLGDVSSARASLERLIGEYGRTPQAASAFVDKAEMQLEAARGSADLEAVRTTYRRIPLLYGADVYPRLAARSQARLESARLGLLLGDLEGAIAELVPALEDEPASLATGRIRLLLGQALLLQGRLEQGLDELQRLVDDPSPVGDGAAAPQASASDLAAADTPIATSTADDRRHAARLISLAHRHMVRPRSGAARFARVLRWPSAGPTLREPIAVATSPNGEILVVDDELPAAVLLDAAGSPMRSATVEDVESAGMTSDGTAVVVTDRELILPFEGQRLNFLQPRSGREAPLRGMRAAARGPFGDWFVVARGWRGVLDYKSRREGQELLSSTRPEFVDVERDELGRIYLLDAENERLVRLGIDRRSVDPVVLGQNWRRPAAFALDALGQVYVLDARQRTVTLYDRRGRQIEVFGPNLGDGIELRKPRDVAVDASGRLLIADASTPFLIVLD